MLLDWAKTKEGAEQAGRLLSQFKKTGDKGITINNFIDLGYSYIHYTLKVNFKKTHYRGFFNQKQEDDLFKILNYYEGNIISIN